MNRFEQEILDHQQEQIEHIEKSIDFSCDRAIYDEIEKARSGKYKDNKNNRKKNIVGQQYGNTQNKEKSLLKIEGEICKLKEEHIYCLNDKGETLFTHTDNKANSVSTPEKYKDILKGSIMTHNHPSGSGLSIQDLHTCLVNQVKEKRAVIKTKEGFGVYSFENNTKESIDLNNYLEEINEIYNRWFDENSNKPYNEIRNGWEDVFKQTKVFKENDLKFTYKEYKND